MNKKQQEIKRAIEYLVGKCVNVYCSYSVTVAPTCWGKVKEFTGTYLVFEEVEYWNGKKYFDYMFHSNSIKKIELR